MNRTNWPREAIVFRVAMGLAAHLTDQVRSGSIVEGIDLVSRINGPFGRGAIVINYHPDDGTAWSERHPRLNYPWCGVPVRFLIPLTAPARALHAIAAAEVES